MSKPITLNFRPIRWSCNDRYFGPITYARDGRHRKFALMLGSGDGDDYPGCRLRLSLGASTIILALPPILKPWRRWVDTSRYEWSKSPNSGYWERGEREYGFSFFEGALHVHYGNQTQEWPGSKSKVFFYPWREHQCIRHSIYDTEGEHFADLPQGRFRPNKWKAEEALKDACPTSSFEFDDFDGERITAQCRIEEREWRRGKGIFRLLFLGRNKVARSLDLRFSAEVGKRKGSWKGGTIGHSCDIGSDETPETAFRRYCAGNRLTFVGAVGKSQ